MRKYFVAILASILLAVLWVRLDAASLSTTVCPGAGCVDIGVGNGGTIGIQITGTWVGTITFQSSVDNSTFTSFAVVAVSDTGASRVTTTTSNGSWQGTITGLNTIRVVFTSYMSGTAVVTTRTVQTAAKFNGGGGGTPGTITGGTCTNQAVTAIDTAGVPTCTTITSAYVGSGIGLTANPLSQFAATTSAQLAGVISNETGSGALVFGTSPSLTTPSITLGTDKQVCFSDGGVVSCGDASFTFDKTETIYNVKIGTGTPIAADAPISLALHGTAADYKLSILDTAYSTNPLLGLLVDQTNSGNIHFYWDNFNGEFDLFRGFGDQGFFNIIGGAGITYTPQINVTDPNGLTVTEEIPDSAGLTITGSPRGIVSQVNANAGNTYTDHVYGLSVGTNIIGASVPYPYGLISEVNITGAGTMTHPYASYLVININDTATISDKTAGSYVSFLKSGTPTIPTAVGYWVDAAGGYATNVYSFWSDEAGVYRIRSDNTFNSVYQGIAALYNPQFTKYTPGATNFERCVPGCQWESNVAVITTEKGGTGTLRSLQLGDANVPILVSDLKNTGSATGKKVVCVDTSTGRLYASSTGTDCSN